MADDLDAVLEQYRASLTPLIDGIQQKRTNPGSLHTTHPTSPETGNGSFSPNNTRGRSPGSRPPTPSPSRDEPLISLQAYVSNILYGLIIQDDNEVLDAIYARNWLNEGAALCTDFRTRLLRFRNETTNRQLLSQTSVAVPADEESRTGSVTYTCRFSGTKAETGEKIESTINAVVEVAWDDESDRRVVTMESFICPLISN